MAEGELSFTDVEIPRAAADCYRLLCEVSRLPEWVAGIATVRVLEAQPDGRAAVAEFVTMPNAGSMSYTLRYRYDDEAMTVHWTTADATERDVRGEAAIAALGPARCRLRYGLFTAVSGEPPAWAREALAQDTPHPVVEAFRRWVEKQL